MEKMKIMVRFEEKAFIRQRMLDSAKKTMQMAWMLFEWVKENEKLMKKMLEDDITERK